MFPIPHVDTRGGVGLMDLLANSESVCKLSSDKGSLVLSFKSNVSIELT